MGILNKDMIEKWFLLHLKVGEGNLATTVLLTEIVECIILFKDSLPMAGVTNKSVFSDTILHWNSVYCYSNTWSKTDCRKKIWMHILTKQLKHLDLSSIEWMGVIPVARIG